MDSIFKFCKKYDDLATALKDWKEQIPGGLAKGKKPGKFNKRQLAMGLEVEMEHTDDPRKALEITIDHLIEDPEHYYDRLKEMEEEIDKDKK